MIMLEQRQHERGRGTVGTAFCRRGAQRKTGGENLEVPRRGSSGFGYGWRTLGQGHSCPRILMVFSGGPLPEGRWHQGGGCRGSSPAHRGRFALPDAGRAATVGRGVPAEPSLRHILASHPMRRKRQKGKGVSYINP
jgi:hypothetical protein